MEKFISLIAAIAAANPAGFTISSKNLQPVTTGYSVAIAETQDSFGKEGIKKVYEAIKAGRANCVGGWLDTETNRYYFDAVIVVPELSMALEIAKLNNQLAIFDLNEMKGIRL